MQGIAGKAQEIDGKGGAGSHIRGVMVAIRCPLTLLTKGPKRAIIPRRKYRKDSKCLISRSFEVGKEVAAVSASDGLLLHGE
jgi:hypothetical protein